MAIIAPPVTVCTSRPASAYSSRMSRLRRCHVSSAISASCSARMDSMLSASAFAMTFCRSTSIVSTIELPSSGAS